MLDAQDIQRLVEVLATKADVAVLDDKISVIEHKQDKMIEILDKMVLRMEALNQEYLVLKERDTRYERWFHELAQKIGITLTP
jgi:hypothetical protein